MARRSSASLCDPTPVRVLRPEELRWRRLARRGEHRKAALALRRILFDDPRPAWWVQLGHQWECAGRGEAARDAYQQGCWLFGTQGEHRKADAVKQLMGRQLA